MGVYTEKPFVRITHIHTDDRIIKKRGWTLTRRWAFTRENTVIVMHGRLAFVYIYVCHTHTQADLVLRGFLRFQCTSRYLSKCCPCCLTAGKQAKGSEHFGSWHFRHLTQVTLLCDNRHNKYIGNSSLQVAHILMVLDSSSMRSVRAYEIALHGQWPLLLERSSSKLNLLVFQYMHHKPHTFVGVPSVA